MKLTSEFASQFYASEQAMPPKPVTMCSVRLLIALLSMLGTSIMYITRVNLNIAILAMVRSTDNDFLANESNPAILPGANWSTGLSDLQVLSPRQASPMGEFDWNPPEQGIILGSFFYGYISTQVIGGRLAESYLSPARLIFIAISMSGVINLLTPFLARCSVPLFVISRIVLGAFQGVIYPAFYCLFSRWIPSHERSTFLPWLDAGSTIGTILTAASSGQIIVWFANLGGWPVVFYVSGTLALLWSILWISFVRSNPEEHPLISKEELILLAEDKQQHLDNNDEVTPSWFNIVTSKVFFGVLMAKITYGIVFDFVTQKVPAYLQDVIRLPVNETGISFSLVMIGYMFTLLSCGAMADTLITRFGLDKCRVRKLFQLISGGIMSVALLAIPSMGLNKWANVLLLTILMSGYGFTSGGDIPIIADIAGPLSGTVFALMNTLCCVSGFTVPYLVGVVIEPAPNSIHLWSYLYIASAGIIALGAISFAFFAKANLQSDWAAQLSVPELPKKDIQVVSFSNFPDPIDITRPLRCHYIPRYDTFPA